MFNPSFPTGIADIYTDTIYPIDSITFSFQAGSGLRCVIVDNYYSYFIYNNDLSSYKILYSESGVLKWA